MTFENLIAFNIALIVAVASPGPALLIAIRTTLASGRKSGVIMGCGLGLMAATWTLMALLGLETVFTLFPLAYTTAKVAGAVYLLYIAVKIWRGAKEILAAKVKTVNNAFRQGIFLNLLNPKSVLFSAAVLVVIFPANMGITDNSIVVLNHFVIEIIFYTLLALAMSTDAVSKRYLKAKTYMDRFASLVIGALGLKILAASERN